MDYRSIITKSIQNSEKAVKEIKKTSAASSALAAKLKGPSNDAIKRFREKKLNEELERFKKLRVDKPPPPPKKQIKKDKGSKIQNEAAEETKTINNSKASTDSIKQSSEKGVPLAVNNKHTVDNGIKKSLALSKDKSKKKKLGDSSLEKKSSNYVDPIKEKSRKQENLPSSVSKDKTSNDTKSQSKTGFVPSFSNYAKILEMANRNSEKPPTFLADPDRAKMVNNEAKQKPVKEDKPVEFKYDRATAKKRKLIEQGMYHKDSTTVSAPKKKRIEEEPTNGYKESTTSKNKDVINEQKKCPNVNKKMDTVYVNSPKASVNFSSNKPPVQSALNRVAPPKESVAPVRRGIAAQLCNNAFKSQVEIPSTSSGMTRKPDKPLHIKNPVVNDKSSATKQLSNDSKSKSKSSDTAGSSKTVSEVSNHVSSKSASAKSKNAPEISKKSSSKIGAMSITMEDDGSDFLHISRKKDSKAPALSAPKRGIAAQSGVEPPRRGIAAQSAVAPGVPVRRGIAAQFGNGPIRYRSNMDTDEEDEDEYDEEDDFIDDSELVTDTQYKSCVQEIHRSLRFDPTKYESVKPWDDCKSMEANYKEIEKEEKRSARLGLKEDLADIKAEEDRMKKKKKKRK